MPNDEKTGLRDEVEALQNHMRELVNICLIFRKTIMIVTFFD
jgi:hypothetical protein